jgi:6-pyruvoyltetrahydropterin/6-carboxytetrahydropterin synthase
MFAVTVRDHMMVAHSLPRAVFGPAQAMHGATYVVEATFRRRVLDDDGIVVDIGAALSALDEVLGQLRYRNLDEHPAFAGVVTSTEVLTRWVADRLSESSVMTGLDGLEVVLRESPDAWVSYTSDG